MNTVVKPLAIGALFGVALSRIGFSSWDEVHRMFAFEDLRLLLTFAGGALVLFLGWKVIVGAFGQQNWPRRAIHPGTLGGGALFGVGWAVSGACPSIALVQIGEGQLAAVFTLVGIACGNWLFALVHEKWLHWDVGSCLDE